MTDEESPAAQSPGADAGPESVTEEATVNGDSAEEATVNGDPAEETTQEETSADETESAGTTDEGPLAAVGIQLDTLRANDTRRRLATLGAVAVGLAVVWLHWLGFVLGGGLVALAQPSIRRGLLAGLGFGVVCWLAFAVWISLTGNFALFLGMEQVFAVTSVIPLAGGLLGSLARGLR